VEGEAARQGVTVRVLFERLIDEAQSGDAPGGPGAGPDSLMIDRFAESVNGDPAALTEGHVEAPTARGTPLASGSSPWPDFGAVTALPRDAIRSTFALTAALVKTSGECARWSWRTFAAVKARCERSTWSTDNGRTT
jgi:hypothetical protein